ncbi:MAG: sulfatase-like hydrolase/transferase [Planctomycetes bacterium]|nr:sulfatase-like hydrolase/transferase [Planctomycetota bacterium]
MRFQLIRRWLWVAPALLAAAVCLAPVAARAGTDTRKPNVLIFLSDDVGYGEYGFQGATDIPTPNIDSIAKQGVRFTQGYVSGPYCSPTRAGLMTGRYQTRFGHEFNSVARQSGLALTETPFPARFKELGYSTCAVGKWHLGDKPEYRPFVRGFDEFYGTLANTPFYHPTAFVDTRVSKEVQKVEDKDFYTTDKYAERCVDWLEQHKNEPWLLYVPFNAQHAPLQSPQKYLDRFPNVTDEKRQLFSAMMSAMDDAVGRVMGKLRDMGQEENTLVFFLADNGGPTQSTTSRNGPLRGFKATTWEGGVRVPFCMQWKGHVPAGKTYENPIIQLDILPTCLAAAGQPIDPAWKLDGANLMPYLAGDVKEKPHQTLYWRFGQQWAVRDGDWKLLVGRGGGKEPELYNLATDIGESKDQASAERSTVERLQGLWAAWNAEQAPPSAPQEKGRVGKAPNKKQAAKRAAKRAQRRPAKRS